MWAQRAQRQQYAATQVRGHTPQDLYLWWERNVKSAPATCGEQAKFISSSHRSAVNWAMRCKMSVAMPRSTVRATPESGVATPTCTRLMPWRSAAWHKGVATTSWEAAHGRNHELFHLQHLPTPAQRLCQMAQREKMKRTMLQIPDLKIQLALKAVWNHKDQGMIPIRYQTPVLMCSWSPHDVPLSTEKYSRLKHIWMPQHLIAERNSICLRLLVEKICCNFSWLHRSYRADKVSPFSIYDCNHTLNACSDEIAPVRISFLHKLNNPPKFRGPLTWSSKTRNELVEHCQTSGLRHGIC